jgi:hypothetical protein
MEIWKASTRSEASAMEKWKQTENKCSRKNVTKKNVHEKQCRIPVAQSDLKTEPQNKANMRDRHQ